MRLLALVRDTLLLALLGAGLILLLLKIADEAAVWAGR